jgi:hypothetical protein
MKIGGWKFSSFSSLRDELRNFEHPHYGAQFKGTLPYKQKAQTKLKQVFGMAPTPAVPSCQPNATA